MYEIKWRLIEKNINKKMIFHKIWVYKNTNSYMNVSSNQLLQKLIYLIEEIYIIHTLLVMIYELDYSWN